MVGHPVEDVELPELEEDVRPLELEEEGEEDVRPPELELELEEVEGTLVLEEEGVDSLFSPPFDEVDDVEGTLTLSKEIAVSAFDAPPASQPASVNAKSAETNKAYLWFLFIKNPPVCKSIIAKSTKTRQHRRSMYAP